MNGLVHQRPERGIASLAVVSALLLIITVGVLYLTQNLVAEQRAAAVGGNRVAAQEAAEAGLTWAQQMLNRPEPIDAACVPLSGSTNASFRRLTVQSGSPNSDLAPTGLFPGCKLSPSGLRCSCASGAGAVSGSPAGGPDPAFAVVFSPVRAADGSLVTDAVRITSTGCSALQGACRPGMKASADGPDAVSQASVIVKLQALVRSRPAATLTCAGECRVTSDVSIINRDTNTNGVLVNAGGASVGCGPGNCLPLQGTPTTAAQLANDSTLAALATQDATCQASALFRRFFYQSVTEFAGLPGVRSLNACSDGAACAQSLGAALSQGYRAFMLPTGFVLDGSLGSAVGSAADPVVLVAQGALTITGGATVNGFVFSNDPNPANLRLISATVRGALVSCGSVSLSQGGTLDYSSQAMSALLQSIRVFRRLSGSWTDLCTSNSSGTVTCR